MKDVPTPLNSEERFLYAITVRLDALCNMMSSFLDVYAKQNGIATTNHTQVDEPSSKEVKNTSTRKKSTSRKSTAKSKESGDAK